LSKIFQKEPTARLGAGPLGSDYDYVALKGHPYFKGIDFDKIFLMKSPICLKDMKRSTLK
jgi:hypothetical protein